ncbi:MAG: hypothetical protein HUJ13_10465 [Hydrogenovibrio crunogenus]|uniref:Uncharacterized protein n=1 Tax=Hydrogenovibrio crunogenus TaxID=39765 RepID=A0A4V1C8Q8_9GAMM|nr:hypothetical protein [Hydrogenovibrio crunogenus]MBD3612811.1 hypothetical protein [Hydrogenovibrio crunogenus]QBZ82754.1 hypothetical protein GHNINEIG_00790 [Hydrogenovibrio crunogenus]
MVTWLPENVIRWAGGEGGSGGVPDGQDANAPSSLTNKEVSSGPGDSSSSSASQSAVDSNA